VDGLQRNERTAPLPNLQKLNHFFGVSKALPSLWNEDCL
jgi:hypothetical protein